MSKYDQYNQAIAQEKQLQQIEQEVRPQVEQQLAQVRSSEQTYNKNLRQAVISNQDVDLKKATQTKKEFQEIKTQVQEPIKELDAERQRIDNLKSGVKTPEQLESQGYKKEVRGDQVVYYREDSYNRKKGDRRTYRDEEYVFTSDGKPVKIIEREDFKDGKTRQVDERKIIDFDSQGRITSIKEFDDGQKEETTNYSFNSDGSFTVKKRDYEKERELKEKAQKEYNAKLAEQRKYKTIEASVDIYGNSEYSETKFNQKTGQWEKTTTTYTKTRPKIDKVSTERTVEATTTPINESKLQSNVVIPGGIPGVNQGTDTSNIPQQTISLNNKNSGVTQGTISAPNLNIESALRQKEYEQANPVQKFFLKDWRAETDAQRKKFDQSRGTDIDALVASTGAGFISGLQGAGQGVRALVTDPVETSQRIVTGLPELPGALIQRAKQNPSGFVGEVTADVLLGTGASRVISSTRSLRAPTVTENPTSIRTVLQDDVITTGARGSFQVESGLIRRTTEDFTFESRGSLQRVDEVDSPGVRDAEIQTITETRTERLSNRPSQNTPRNTGSEVATRSQPGEITDPNPTRTRSQSDINSNIADDAVSREVFRGEIETDVLNSRGEVIKTQKLPAELIREGETQTLFIDGKPFDVKSRNIPTRESIIQEDGLSRVEGEFGFDLKRDTLETTTTDLTTGNQRRSLTQEIVDPTGQEFASNGASRSSQRRLSQERRDLLGDSPQNPPETVQQTGALTDPIATAQKRSRKQPNVNEVSQKTSQEFEGISMDLQKESVSVSKDASPAIMEGQFSERIDLNKPQEQIAGTPAQKKIKGTPKRESLESPVASEERRISEVFGADFASQVKTSSSDPFSSSDMFKSIDDDVQVFTKQESKSKSNVATAPETKSPSRSSGNQEMIIEQAPKTKTSNAKNKNPNQEIGLDISVGVDVVKAGTRGAPARPGILPSFKGDQVLQSSQLFGQEVQQRTGQTQSIGQLPDLEVATQQKTDQEIINDQIISQGGAQITNQSTSQINEMNTPTPPPVIPPGTPGTPPPGIPRIPRDVQIQDPFKADKKRGTKQKGQFAGSFTALVQGIEIDQIDPNKKVTGLEKRAILRGRGF